MNTLNFSWIIDSKVAGHAALNSDEDIAWLKQQGIRAVVRMADSTITPSQLGKMGVADFYEPVVGHPAPDEAQIERMLAFINSSISKNQPVGVS